MNPDRMVIGEAMRTFTYLNLYGYLTDAVVVNRLFPDGVGDYFAAWRGVQQEHLELVQSAFAPVPVLRAPFFEQEVVGPGDARPARGRRCSPTPTRRRSCTTRLAQELEVLDDGAALRLDAAVRREGRHLAEEDRPRAGGRRRRAAANDHAAPRDGGHAPGRGDVRGRRPPDPVRWRTTTLTSNAPARRVRRCRTPSGAWRSDWIAPLRPRSGCWPMPPSTSTGRPPPRGLAAAAARGGRGRIRVRPGRRRRFAAGGGGGAARPDPTRPAAAAGRGRARGPAGGARPDRLVSGAKRAPSRRPLGRRGHPDSLALGAARPAPYNREVSRSWMLSQIEVGARIVSYPTRVTAFAGA